MISDFRVFLAIWRVGSWFPDQRLNLCSLDCQGNAWLF